MTACTVCSGSRWLGDNPSLGRCVCVTPEAMRALDDALNDAESWQIDVLEKLGLPDDAGLSARLAELSGRKDTDMARDLLEDFLTSVGLPAVPAGALDNPALEKLVDFLMT